MEYEKDESKENEFRKSLLLVVSGAFCETNVDQNLYISTKSIMLSFSSIQSASFNDLNEIEQTSLKAGFETFQKIIFTPKYKRALWTLVETMNFRCSSEELKGKFESAIKYISALKPMLVSNVTLNGMISVTGNIFINMDILFSLKHIDKKKQMFLNKRKARQLSLIRLICHATTHLLIRFMLSNFNDNFFVSTPQNSKKYEMIKYFNFEGGYRLEEILFGTCENVIYSTNRMIEKFFNTDWNNEDLPIFDQADLIDASNATKFKHFSGVDVDVDEFFE